MKCPKCKFDNPDNTRFCSKCAAPLHSSEKTPVSRTKTLRTPVEELNRGTTFVDRYEFIEELGKGGMGRVYKVFDKKINEEVALKVLKPEISDDKSNIERFSNELKIARKITHKNVCRMYDLNEKEGTHYITMEYVPGEDLKSLIRRVRQLTAGTTISIAKQVCEGLAEAHRLGVVHRDLKPSNIMIDKEGNARIMDFGIARSLKTKRMTLEGMTIGTPEYMSPERAEGKEVDHRSDIYSLGVMLYEMVTGRVPYEGDTPFSIALKHKSETPTSPKEVNSQIPEDLSLLILRCMERDKEKRYQSALGLLSELDKIEKSISTPDRAFPKRKLMPSKEKTITFGLKRLFISALVCVFLAIIGVFIWQNILQKQPKLQDEVGGIGGIKNPEAEFAIELWVDKENGTYKPGEEIKFFFKCNKDCYLTLLDIGTSGQVTILFPNQYQTDNKVKAGEICSIPGEDAQYVCRAKGPPGEEVVKAIATLDKTTLYEEEDVKPSTPKKPFSEFKESEELVARDIVIALKPVDSKKWTDAEIVIKIVEEQKHEPFLRALPAQGKYLVQAVLFPEVFHEKFFKNNI